MEDWDWIFTPELTDEKYYSPPYSIRPPSELSAITGICKAPGTEYIPDGRVELVFNNNNDTWYDILFHIILRVVQPPGETTWPQERYHIFINTISMKVQLRRYEDGSLETWSHDLYTDIWDQVDPLAWNWFRVTWWSVPGAGLIVRYEVKIGNTWYRLCDDFTGVTDMFTGEAYNRVGFGFKWGYADYGRPLIDNIRIYKAV